jgi:hypothetical protein
MLFLVLSTQGAGGGGGENDQDAIVNALAESILKDIREPFDVRKAEARFPVSYT